MTFQLVLQDGVWCESSGDCQYDSGGLFISTTARKLLFTGYYDPTYIKYYNMKLRLKNVSFECAEDAVNVCGRVNNRCSDAGILMKLPGGDSHLMAYNVTPNDEFFAPYFEISDEGELIWENSMHEAVSSRAVAVKNEVKMNSSKWIERVMNPYFALYPTWTGDKELNKFTQCKKRIFGGNGGHFQSCFRSMKTGRTVLNEKEDIFEYMGNTSIVYFSEPSEGNGSLYVEGKISYHQDTYGWDGFFEYPYVYSGRSSGSDFLTLQSVSYFEDQTMLPYTLDQTELDIFLKSIPVSFPFIDGM